MATGLAISLNIYIAIDETVLFIIVWVGVGEVVMLQLRVLLYRRKVFEVKLQVLYDAD